MWLPRDGSQPADAWRGPVLLGEAFAVAAGLLLLAYAAPVWLAFVLAFVAVPWLAHVGRPAHRPIVHPARAHVQAEPRRWRE